MVYAWEQQGHVRYNGVSWHKRRKRYRVKIKHAGRTYNLGYFDDPRRAGMVYDAAARRLHGPDAQLNWPRSPFPERLWAENFVSEKLA